MHPEVTSDKPGRCPKCGMDLVKKGEEEKYHKDTSGIKTYKPLLIIIALILLSSLASGFTMQKFMAGFFLVFSGFKLLDLDGFAQGYSTYDLLAMKWFQYGYIYPFLELALGLSYLSGFMPTQTAWMTLVLMTFSGVGVALKVAKKEKFQCVCLGTIIKVPLTEVTLIEDFGMSLMALVLIIGVKA